MREGVVVSDKMDKTVVVRSSAWSSTRIRQVSEAAGEVKAHDDDNRMRGRRPRADRRDRPLSKDKRWRVRAILEKAV